MKLPIVDENDKIVGYKEKDELNSRDIYRVSRLVILNSKGQLLMAQRALTKKKDPGAWGLPLRVRSKKVKHTNLTYEKKQRRRLVLS